MEHSIKFELVKNYYEHGRWSIQAVKNAVVRGWINSTEFAEITGEEYGGTGNGDN